jgi:hypothetical protein
VTHLIPAGRLNRDYFLRLTGDHAFSQSILGYLLTGDRPQEPRLVQYALLPLHGIRRGSLSMRRRYARFRGRAQAARFIADERLRPVRDLPWLPRADRAGAAPLPC